MKKIAAILSIFAIALPAIPAGAARGEGMVISEIHYHPPKSQGRAEFIEIANAGKSAADLSGWRVAGGIEFTFPAGSRLEAGACLVLCEDLASFRQTFGGSASA